ncbi:MAG: YczE/YyaS/YitT family protein [Peptococcaceae bacterium]
MYLVHKDKFFLRIIYLFTGLMIAAFGVELMLQSKLGLYSFGVLYTGLEKLTKINYGHIVQIACLLWIVVAYIMGLKPSLATIIDMLFFGWFLNHITAWSIIPGANHYLQELLYLITGLFIFSFGIVFYLKADLGAGPHDGLMVVLVKQTRKSIKVVKTSLDAVLLISGVLLGGVIGVGTVISTLFQGYIIDKLFLVVRLPGLEPGKITQP